MRARPLRFPSAFLVLAACLAGCEGDVCANIEEDPSLEIAGAELGSLEYESFEPGAARPLEAGPQGGMHIWMQARLGGVCPETTIVERRVVSESGELYHLARGRLEFVPSDGPDPRFELDFPLAIPLCPDPSARPVVGERLRFVVTATDADGRSAEAEIPFVPTCPPGEDCDALCPG